MKKINKKSDVVIDEDNLTKKKLLTFFCKKCNLLIKNSMVKSKPENGLLFSYQLN